MNAPSILPIEMATRQESEAQLAPLSLSELFDKFIGFARRHLAILLIVTSCALILGFVYLLTTPAQYSASSKLLIDSSKLKVLQQQQSPTSDTPLDSSQVDSQVELLKSDNIGLIVVKKLHLNEDPEFIGQGDGLFRRIFGSRSPKLSDFDATQRALGVFLRNRAISRVGRTYAIEIDYTSLSAKRAAEIANAIGDAYIEDQLDAKYQATRRGTAWLQDRMAELQSQASTADRAVLEYKEKNNIVDVFGGAGSGPRLIGEQQLSDLNSQLGAARSAAAEAQARLDRIDEVMKHDISDAVVSDSLHSEVISKLRTEYYELSSRESIWAARYGPEHIAVVNLRTQMEGVRNSIQDELRRIARSYKNEAEVAKNRVAALEKDLAGLVTGSQSTNRDRLGLSELESAAKALHAIYDNFLQRDMEAIQQQSFPITEARIISPAVAPTSKSSPVKSKVLAMAGAIGLILSLGIAAARDLTDRVFRSTTQVDAALRTTTIAVLPMLTSASNSGKKASVHWAKNIASKLLSERSPKANAALSKLFDIASDFDVRRKASRYGSYHTVNRTTPSTGKQEFICHVIDEPLSTYAEAFRSMKVAIDLSGSTRVNKVIGVTSTLPREGKSTVSSNLSQSIASAGKTVILIDCDLRNPTLTRSLAPIAKKGLLEVLSGDVDLESVTLVDKVTNLVFLPAVLSVPIVYTSEILASEVFKQLIASLKKKYDYIVIDLPPIAPVVDARAASHLIDSFLYVIEWGQTKVSFVQRQLAATPEVWDRMLGVVLNKTNVKLFERYEGNFGKYQYKNYYGASIDEVERQKSG